MQGKEHGFAHLAFDPVVSLPRGKEPTQALLRHIGGNGLGVHALASLSDGVFVQVSCKYLDRGRAVECACVFVQQHRNRVRLLSCRASGRPDANRVIWPFAIKKGRNHRFQGCERLAIPEEIRDANEHVLEQRPGFTGMRAQKAQVMPHLRDPADLHPSGDPAQDRRSLVVGKIASGARAQKSEDFVQRGFFG